MKKPKLKTGNIAKLRNGTRALVLIECSFYLYEESIDSCDNILSLYNGGIIKLTSYSNNLIHKDNDEYDIVNISWPLNNAHIVDCNEINELLLWERKEEKPILIHKGVEWSETTLKSMIDKQIK